jgi:hypothetical protein
MLDGGLSARNHAHEINHADNRNRTNRTLKKKAQSGQCLHYKKRADIAGILIFRGVYTREGSRDLTSAPFTRKHEPEKAFDK